MNFLNRIGLSIVFVSALTQAAWLARAEPEQGSSSLAAFSGEELVRQLQQPGTRDHAYYELWRRAGDTQDEGLDAFLDEHYDVEVVVCPQGAKQEPVYLVLHGFLRRSLFTDSDDYTVTHPDELFRSAPRAVEGMAGHRAIDAFTARGKRLAPFGGDNVLEGTLADINGDGMIERVEVAHYGVEGLDNVDVLQVWAVKPKAPLLLSVLLNWGEREWSYRLGDINGRGTRDIEIGPTQEEGMKPKAVFTWDADARSFAGPEAQAGDHFYRLGRGDVWTQLQTLKSGRLSFPKDTDFKEPAPLRLGPAAEKSVPPPAQPYHPTAWEGLSNDVLLRFMKSGRNAYDFERESVIRDHLPQDFWALDPKEAALALVDANRTPEHRGRFQLAIDDRGVEGPPATGSLAFSDSSSRCYIATDTFYFLRVDPVDSYLAYARTRSGGVVFYDVVSDQPSFDLRVCPLNYEDARRLAGTVWWLDRLRSRSGAESGLGGMSTSTADGTGNLVFRSAEGTPLINRTGTLWAAQLSERWTKGYDHAAFLNFSAYLLADALTERLGTAWMEAEIRSDAPSLLPPKGRPTYSEAESRRLTLLTIRFLSEFSPAQDRISMALVACAAQVAGTRLIPGTRPLLEKIASSLPADPPTRTYEEVSAEYLNVLSTPDAGDPQGRATHRKRLSELKDEQDRIAFEAGANSLSCLRRTIKTALRRFALADDPDALYARAVARGEEGQWALQRLLLLDRARYVQALEGWLGHSEERWVRQIFAEIRRVDPVRATAIAASRPSAEPGALTGDVFGLLQNAGQLTDENARRSALLAVLQNPKSGFAQRGQVIDLLVPPDAPLRYPQREVDDALLHVLEPDQADDVVNFTLPAACLALALRQRTEAFDRIMEVLATTQDAFIHGRILSALVVLAQADPVRLNPRLESLIAPELKATNKQMSELLWAIWSADLRNMLPELERLGTAGPDDYEDAKAFSGGGEVTPVLGRFHLARQIADVWNSTDALTRIRLLTALALDPTHRLAGESLPERVFRLRTALREAASTLTVPQRRQVAAFLQTILELPEEDSRLTLDARQKLVAMIRAEIVAP